MEQKSKILIVDDEPIGRQLLEAVLYTEGFELLFAENGMQALDITINDLPDLILMDVMMPEMDGFEVCKKIRKHEKAQKIPIILITALDDRDSRIRGLDAGADDYISKPFDRVEILAKVKNITQLNRYRQIINNNGEPDISTVLTKPDKTPLNFDTELLYDLAIPPVQFVKRFFPHFSYYPSNNSKGENLIWIDDNNQFTCFALLSMSKENILSDRGFVFHSLIDRSLKSGVIQKASDILNLFLKNLENFKKEYQRDDLDIKDNAISLFVLNKNNFDIHYAGYNIPVFLVSFDGITETDFDTTNTISEKNKFSNYTYQLERNATIIVLSQNLYHNIKRIDKNNTNLSDLAIQLHNYPESFDQEVSKFLDKNAEKTELRDFSFISLKI